MLSFYLFRKYFFSPRSVSLIKIIAWICLSGLTVSVAALILIISVMGGFGEAIKGRILSEEAHLVINFKSSPFLPGKVLPAESLMPQMTEEQKSGIRDIVVFESQDLIIKSRLGFQGAEARGYSKELFHKMRARPCFDGRPQGCSPLHINTPLMDGPQAPGKAPANPLNLPHQEAGLQAPGRGPGPWRNSESSSKRAQGIGGAPQQPSGGQNDGLREMLAGPELFMEMGIEESEKISLIPLGSLLLPPSFAPPVKKAAARLLSPQAPRAGRPQNQDSFLIFYRQGALDFGSFSEVRYGAEISLHDPSLYPLYEQIFKDFGAESWAGRNSTLFFALKLEKFIMTLFIALAFIISCFGISSALFLLSAQKAKDLGHAPCHGAFQEKAGQGFFRGGILPLFVWNLFGLFNRGFERMFFKIQPDEYSAQRLSGPRHPRHI